MPHAIITGGADGIGHALVTRYARAGYLITILDRDVERSTAACQAIQAQGGSATFVHEPILSSIAPGLARLAGLLN